MLKHYAVLSDFADFIGIEAKIHENNFSDDQSGEETGPPIQDLTLAWEHDGNPISLTLTKVPDGTTFGLTDFSDYADIRIRSCIGYTFDEEQFLNIFEQRRGDDSSFVGDEKSGFVSIETMDSDEDFTYVILELKAPRVWLGSDHLERLNCFLARFHFLTKDIHFFGLYLEQWDSGRGESFNTFVHQAMKRVDRIFLIGEEHYRESDLDMIDWSLPGVSSDNPASFPEGFTGAQFIDKAFWDGNEQVDISELRMLIWTACVEQLNANARTFSSENDQIWLFNHEIVTSDMVIMSMNSSLSLGSAAPRKIKETAIPL
jgi:hypothetical protein